MWTEVRGDRAVGGEEALCVARGRATPHPAFPLPGRLMGMLRPVMQALVPPMLDAGQYRAPRRAVTGEFVGDHHARHGAQALEQRAEKLLGRDGTVKLSLLGGDGDPKVGNDRRIRDRIQPVQALMTAGTGPAWSGFVQSKLNVTVPRTGRGSRRRPGAASRPGGGPVSGGAHDPRRRPPPKHHPPVSHCPYPVAVAGRSRLPDAPTVSPGRPERPGDILVPHTACVGSRRRPMHFIAAKGGHAARR